MKTDLDKANDTIAKCVAELDAKFHGHDGFPGAYFSLKGGGYATYVYYTQNGVKAQGKSFGPRAPTAIDAAKGWVAAIAGYFRYAEPDATLFWRKRPILECLPAISFEEMQEGYGHMSPEGWVVSSRFALVEGEPAPIPENPEHPEDFSDEDRRLTDEARARYFAARKMEEVAHG